MQCLDAEIPRQHEKLCNERGQCDESEAGIRGEQWHPEVIKRAVVKTGWHLKKLSIDPKQAECVDLRATLANGSYLVVGVTNNQWYKGSTKQPRKYPDWPVDAPASDPAGWVHSIAVVDGQVCDFQARQPISALSIEKNNQPDPRKGYMRTIRRVWRLHQCSRPLREHGDAGPNGPASPLGPVQAKAGPSTETRYLQTMADASQMLQSPIAFQDDEPVVCAPVEKKCGTPDCTLSDFHPGPHSCDTRANKRPRTCATEKVAFPVIQKTIDSRGLSSYGGMCKSGHREAFAHACVNTDGPVAYLEGPDGALTYLLLDRGVAPDRLMVFNLSSVVAKAIEAKFPLVECRVQDICEAAADAETEQFSVIWFDMCGNDFGAYEVHQLVDCAQYKFFTLSCRQLLCSDQQSVLCSRLVEAGEKIVERSLYTGCSGKAMNMVFVASKPSCRKKSKQPSSASDESGTECSNEVSVGTIVRFPLSYWKNLGFVEAYGYKVFDSSFMMGSVHSQVANCSSSYRLTFQLAKGGSMLCSEKYSRDCVVQHTI